MIYIIYATLLFSVQHPRLARQPGAFARNINASLRGSSVAAAAALYIYIYYHTIYNIYI